MFGTRPPELSSRQAAGKRRPADPPADGYDYHHVQFLHERDPAAHAAVVTPSDTVDLANATRAILVGTGGDLKVTTVGGETVVIPAAPVGVLPLQVTRIWATSTAASNLTALW